MGDPFGDIIFLAGCELDGPAFNAQGILALDHDEVFIEVMNVLFRYAIRRTLKYDHLTSVCTVVNKALHSGALLVSCNSVYGISHEFWKFVHHSPPITINLSVTIQHI